jgi:hypothetical protein
LILSLVAIMHRKMKRCKSSVGAMEIVRSKVAQHRRSNGVQVAFYRRYTVCLFFIYSRFIVLQTLFSAIETSCLTVWGTFLIAVRFYLEYSIP